MTTVTITEERYRKYQTYELAFEDVREWLERRAALNVTTSPQHRYRQAYQWTLEYLREREKFHELVL